MSVNSKEYDFKTFQAKDLFECKLAGITPDFGYISNRNRRQFYETLLRVGFMEKVTPKQASLKSYYLGHYLISHSFEYAHSGLPWRTNQVVPGGRYVAVTNKAYKIVSISRGLGIDA